MNRKVLYAIVIVLALILIAGIVVIAVSMKQPEKPADAPVIPTDQVATEETLPLQTEGVPETEAIPETEPPATAEITEEELPDVDAPAEATLPDETKETTEATEEPTESNILTEEDVELVGPGDRDESGGNRLPDGDDWSVGEIEL